jgi:DNA topoisomerase-1
MRYLVLVESPAKCKKISQILNNYSPEDSFYVEATFGHIVELRSLEQIDFPTFTYTPTIIPAKKKVFTRIRKIAKMVDEVLFFMDADREGEGIAYSLCKMLRISWKTAKRGIFREITENAIISAFRSPTRIDISIVNAQQTRQIIDLLIGFQISPVLWANFPYQSNQVLSAGRCQIPAVKLIYDREIERQQHPPQMNYKIVGYFTNQMIPFVLDTAITDETTLMTFLHEEKTFMHQYECSDPTPIHFTPPRPLTTSTLLQFASNKIQLSPRDTMKIAQTLYEKGYISYMRTDSEIYSETFCKQRSHFIIARWGEEYSFRHNALGGIANPWNILCDKSGSHEAIRPTDITREKIDSTEDIKAQKLYKLIWNHALACGMTEAKGNHIIASLTAARGHKFIFKSIKYHFLGWKVVEETHSEIYYQYLKTIARGIILPYNHILVNTEYTNNTPYYTEARLIQLLEENGIGRPSTYASIIDKILDRNYVRLENVIGEKKVSKEYKLIADKIEIQEKYIMVGEEKRKLVIQPIGISVIEFLNKWFDGLFRYEYSRVMEAALDLVAKNKMDFEPLCREYNENIHKYITELNGSKI